MSHSHRYKIRGMSWSRRLNALIEKATRKTGELPGGKAHSKEHTRLFDKALKDLKLHR